MNSLSRIIPYIFSKIEHEWLRIRGIAAVRKLLRLAVKRMGFEKDRDSTIFDFDRYKVH